MTIAFYSAHIMQTPLYQRLNSRQNICVYDDR